MENLEIRKQAKKANVYLWQIADKLQVSEPTLTRLLRRKVDKETRTRLLDAIKEIKGERKEADQ